MLQFWLVRLVPLAFCLLLSNNTSALPSLGVGLNFSMGTRFNARLDWGIPLVDIEAEGDSLQEDGVYFSLDYNFL